MVYREKGIPLDQWASVLEEGVPASPKGYFDMVRKANLRNSIFIDNTASAEISGWYAAYLKESVAVVTCNKIACSDRYSQYLELKHLARTYTAPFLFETNVGAGLPVIDTLKNLVLSGRPHSQDTGCFIGEFKLYLEHLRWDRPFCRCRSHRPKGRFYRAGSEN